MRFWLTFLFVVLISILAGFSQSKPSSEDVSLAGTLESPLTLTTEGLKFSVSITNSSDQGLNSIRIINIPSDYKIDLLCTPGCKQYSSDLIAEQMAPKSKLSAWGLLKPLHPHRRQRVSIVVSWTQNTESNSSVVTLGENEVQNTRYFYYITYLYPPIKTLAVPATLALLAYLLNKRAKRREEAKADADKEQSIRAEIWKQMLPISHKLASKHYLPISLAIEHTARHLAEYATAMYGDLEKLEIAKNAAHRAFYYALLLDRRMDHTRQKVGGLIFKDLRGEELAVGAWLQYKKLLVGDADSRLDIIFRSSASRLKFYETFEQFSERFFAPPNWPNLMVPEMEGGWRVFDQWLRKKSDVLNSVLYLRAFGAIIDYELNRPYEYWYHPGPILQLDCPENPEKQLGNLPQLYNINPSSVEGVLRFMASQSNLARMEEYLESALGREDNAQHSQRGIFVIFRAFIRSPFARLLSRKSSPKGKH